MSLIQCQINLHVVNMHEIQDSLPKPSLTPEPAKMADMISISPKGLCGGNDFRDQFLKEDRLSAGKAKGHQVEKSRYVMDNKILS
jgi:hypothetical protein